MRSHATFLSMVLSLSLVACGGGGGGDGGSPATSTPGASTPTPATSSPQALAAAGDLSGKWDEATGMATLQWKNTFGGDVQYLIGVQRIDGSGTFDTLVDRGANGPPVGVYMAWPWSTYLTRTFRVLAVQPDGSALPMLTADGQGTVRVKTSAPSTPPENPGIVTDQLEPLAGTVKMSIGGGYPFTAVEWYLDLTRQFTNVGQPGNPWLWDTTKSAQGPHFVLARIQLPDGTYKEVRRTLTVSNNNLKVDTYGYRDATGAQLSVKVDASAGVASVAASLDGTPLPTLFEMNGCGGQYSMSCGWGLNRYYETYQFNAPLNACSGQHAFVVTVTDKSGNTKNISVPVPAYEVPWLTLDSPADRSSVSGTLKIKGSVCSDRPGSLPIWATLSKQDRLPILQTTVPQGPFSFDFDLTGFPAGEYNFMLDNGATISGTKSNISRTVTVIAR